MCAANTDTNYLSLQMKYNREDTTTEANKSNQESRWHRPNIYLTIVGIYLLVSLAIMLTIYGHVLISFMFFTHPTCSGPMSCTLLPYFALFVGALILTALSYLSISGSIVLFRRRKHGIRTPLVALILTTFILPINLLLLDEELYRTSISSVAADDVRQAIIGFSSLASAVVMYPLLIIGRKRVQLQQ